MQPIVIGTAGHIDHGKTSLIRRLTGVDTDSLKEEQKRGITIELGFTHLQLDGGRRLGFVDVPGHERLVRTMVAGATGIDVVLLVIAADEGVMPQTREHLNVLELLGVRVGAVVLTKVDLVDEELLELAQMDVVDYLDGTFLDGAPLIPFSAETGAGEAELRRVLAQLADEIPPRAQDRPARLSVDRVFSQKGFGTVVTGTLSSGQIAVGDSLELLPAGQGVKVRGLQTFGEGVDRALPGGRTALNLQGVDWQKVERGDILATPGTLPVTPMIDVHLETLSDMKGPFGGRVDGQSGEILPSKHAPRARFLSGTLEVMGRFTLLDADFLLPGQSGYAQIRLERPIPAKAGDRFIIRSESPVMTLAGGVILQSPAPRYRKRHFTQALAHLRALNSGDPQAVAEMRLKLAGLDGLKAEDLCHELGRTLSEAQLFLERSDWALDTAGGFVHRDCQNALSQRILDRLERHHQERPLSLGLTRGILKPGDYIHDRQLQRSLDALLADGRLQKSGSLYRQARFEVKYNKNERLLMEYLQKTLLAEGLSPTPIAKILADYALDGVRSAEDLVSNLIADGQIIRVKEGHYWHHQAITSLKKTVGDFLRAEGEMAPTDFKSLTGLSRKFAIPLLEYLDKSQFTQRVGDKRRLRI